MRAYGLIAAVALLGSPVVASATVISLSGADLYSNPDVTFPADEPVVVGDSLVFYHGRESYQILRFDLGAYDLGSEFTIGINLTRLPCTDCTNAEFDFDPNLMLSDGTNMVGFVAADNDGGSGLGSTLTDVLPQPSLRTLVPLFQNAGYPADYESFDISLAYQLLPGTTSVTGSFLDSAGTYYESERALDPLANLTFVMVRDFDGHRGEQYQINSLTLTFGSVEVPEPSTLALFGLGLLGLRLARRRRSPK